MNRLGERASSAPEKRQKNDFGVTKELRHQTTADLRKVTAQTKIPRRLAPLDHIKILYKGASGKMSNAKQAPIKQKKDLMHIVRRIHAERNAPRKKTLATMKRAKVSLIDQDTFDSGQAEINNLEQTVNRSARKYNTLVRDVEVKKGQIDKLLDQMAIIQREVQSLRASENADTAETKQIKALEEAIKVQNQKIELELFLKAQLEHMYRRLKHNMVAYNSHINDLQTALDASTRELNEVRLLIGQLESKKNDTEKELNKTREESKQQAEYRSSELQTLRDEADRAKRMLEWREERRNQRDLAQAQAAGDLDAAGEAELLNQK
jgi:chromosome segregation ATPase